jgi:hypothetical protein
MAVFTARLSRSVSMVMPPMPGAYAVEAGVMVTCFRRARERDEERQGEGEAHQRDSSHFWQP